MKFPNQIVYPVTLAFFGLMVGCGTPPLPSDPPDSVRWPGLSDLPWSGWAVATSYPKLSYRTRVHPNFSHGNQISGHLAEIEVRNEDSFMADARISVSESDGQNGQAWTDVSRTYSWNVKGAAADTHPSSGKQEKDGYSTLDSVRFEANAVIATTMVVGRTNEILKITARATAPEGWSPMNSRDMHDILYKDDTQALDSGCNVTVTLWNRRPEPVVIEYVLAENGLQRMPDYQRHIGGGSLTLLGGETQSVFRHIPAPEWEIWTRCKTSVLQ